MLPMSAGVRLWGVLDEALENHLPAPEGVVGADGDEIPLMIQGRVWTEAPPDEKKYLTQCPQKRASYRSCSLVSEFGWSRCVCKPEDDSRYHIWRGEGNPYLTSRQTTWMVCLLPRPCRSENKCDICGNTLKSKFKLNNHIVKMRLKVPKMRNCVHVVGDWWFYQWIFLHCRGQTAERALCVEWFSTTLPLLFGQSSGRKDYLICSLLHCIVLILPRGEMPWHHLASPGAHKPGVFVLPYCEVLP